MRELPVAIIALALLLAIAPTQTVAGAEGDDWTSASGGLPTSGTYFGVAIGDVDNDGNADIVAAGDGSGVRVFLGDGTGLWTALSSQPATSGGYGDVCLGDYDGDGNADIFAGSPGNGDGNPRGLHVWRGNGAGRFTEVTGSTGLPTSGYWRGVAVGDVDGDGDLDLVATNGYGTSEGIHAFVGDGSGAFEDESTGLPGNQDRDSKVVLADFNGDGDLDLAAGGGAGVDVYLGNGGGVAGMVWTQSSVGLPNGRFSGLSAADVDGDGATDLVVSAYNGGGGDGVRAYRNVRGAALWESVSTGLPGSGDYIDNTAIDVNDDGRVDIVTAGSYGSTYGVHVFVGNGGTSWTEASPGLPTGDQYVGVAVADIDNDGSPDVAAGKRTRGGGVFAWKNPLGPPRPEVEVLSPSGGEAWTGGTVHQVRWTASEGTPPYTVDLRYSTDGGGTYPYSIGSGIEQASAGSMEHPWTLPRQDGSRYRVMVEVTDSAAGSQTATSLLDFEVDVRAPVVSGTFPADEATGVSTDAPVIITFSEGMDPSSSEEVTISGPGGPSLSSPSWAGAQLTLHTAGLQASMSYTVSISDAATDDSDPGNPLPTDHEFSFLTGTGVSPTPPSVTSTSPAYDANPVPVDTAISITFSKAMDRSSAQGAVSSSPPIGWTPSWSAGDTVLTLTPGAWLNPHTSYRVTVGTGAMSAAGVAMTSQYQLPFRTGAPPDLKAPSVVDSIPTDRRADVPPGTDVVITFSEAMDRDATERAVSLSGGTISSMTWSAGDTVLTIDVSVGGGQRVVVTVSRAATDLAGNAMEEELTFYYRTKASESQATPGPGVLGAIGVLAMLGSALASRHRR